MVKFAVHPRGFVLFQGVQTGSGARLALYLKGAWLLSRAIQRIPGEVDRSLSSAELLRMTVATSVPQIQPHMPSCLAQGNFTAPAKIIFGITIIFFMLVYYSKPLSNIVLYYVSKGLFPCVL